MAPHSSTLAWKIPWTGEPVGCSPWGFEVSDTTERLHFHFSLSCIGGNGNPLQCSCLKSPRDGGAWWAAVSGVTQRRTRLKWLSSSSSSMYAHVEQETTVHSSILAWRIPWTEESGRLWSVGSQRVRHDLATNTTTIEIKTHFSYPVYTPIGYLLTYFYWSSLQISFCTNIPYLSKWLY